jgi:hypothetical protein
VPSTFQLYLWRGGWIAAQPLRRVNSEGVECAVMNTVEVVTIVALFTGPAIAHIWHKWYDNRKWKTERKRKVFTDLMATRANKVSATHVEALNAIDVEFSSGKGSDKRVVNAWHLYLDHLNDRSVDQNNQDAIDRWVERGNQLLVEVLFEMSQSLGYDFDKVALKNSVYSPKAHGELDADQYQLRKFLVEVMAGKRPLWTGVMTGEQPLKMEIVNIPTQPGPQAPQGDSQEGG